ncbi:MAG TPA: putative Ig domain-containing protein, partial [Vicinamibacterales bacterium]|nr:putative Ig domain-containing protein [Vicinamibacterales bacterium]
DGGGSWSQIVTSTGVNGCTDMAMQVQGVTGYVFFSCGNFAQGTVYRILDDDTATQEPIFSTAGQGRSSIAVAPSNEAIVYLLSAQATNGGGPGTHGLHGVYRSISNGDPGSFTTQRQGNVAPTTTAQRINQLLLSNPVYGLLADCGFGPSNQFLNQGWYDNVIAVDPLDPNRVWAGGVDLWRSDNAGVDWGTAGFWWFDKGIDPEYHHADQHNIVFHPQFNGTSNLVMFSTSDGGVDRIDNARAAVNTTLTQICGTPVGGGGAWVDRNNGYVTTQFYAGVPYPNGQTYFGGLQDNGTQRGASGSQLWASLIGGDGGYAAVDTLGDANSANDVLFAENTSLSIQRSVNGGASFANASTGITGDSGFAFIAPFTMNQGFKQQLWTGGFFIWRTVNQATNWVRASATTPGSGSVSALAAHPLDGNRVIVGMSDGYLLYTTSGLTTDSTTTWLNTRPSTAFVSWIAWDPTDLNVAYATVSTFTGTTLFKSVNGGATWTASMGSGGTALPSVPALSVVVNPDNAQQVFVGTDLGVFVSLDGGANWQIENAGFARTPVEALVFNETAPRRLFAFTHGRGAWTAGTGCPAITVTPASLPGGSTGVAYSQQLGATGGTGPYSFVVEAGGQLPPDLTLSSGGLLAGNPTTLGTFNFTVRAMDANACPGSRAYAIVISPSSCTPITITPATLPNTTAFAAYNQTLTASGGTGPYAFAVTSGSLPAGLTLSSSGALTGSATAPGVFTFTVTATAAGGCTGAQAYTVTVGQAATTTVVTFEPGPYVYRGTPFTATATVTGPGGLSQSLPVTYTGNCTTPTTTNGCTASASYAGTAVYLPSAATQSITILQPTDPQPVTGFKVDSVNGGLVRFRWTAPLFGPAPQGYVLEGGTSSTTVLASINTNSTSPVFEAVVPTGAWVAWMRTQGSGSTSARSNEVPVIVNLPVRPSAPINFTGVVNGSDLGLSWKNTFDGGPPTSMVLDVTGPISTSVPLGLGESFAFSGVPPGTYTLGVRAVNGGGASSPSTPLTLTFPGACSGLPLPPANFLAYKTGTVISLVWDPPATGAAPTSYLVNVTGSFVGSVPLTTSAISAPVGPGSYTLSVASVNACGASAATTPQTVVIP